MIIPEFDYNPCGGTHPAHTGEVGMIKILGWERHRGNIRLEFICGWRALRDYTRKQSMVREVSKLLMTSDAELVAQAERLVAERDALKQSLVEKERLLLEVEVRQHLAQADQLGGVRLLEMTFSDRSIQQLQQFAHQAVAQAPNVVCLLAATGEKLQLVFARGAEVNVAVNQLIKDTLPLIDGKGGGNAAMAQGGGQPTRPAQEVLDHAKQLLKAALS